ADELLREGARALGQVEVRGDALEGLERRAALGREVERVEDLERDLARGLARGTARGAHRRTRGRGARARRPPRGAAASRGTRRAISTATAAASTPLWPPVPPARSQACSTSSTVSTPNAIGTPLSCIARCTPSVTPRQTYSKWGVPPRTTTPNATRAS